MWLILALLTAVGEAGKDLCGKKSLLAGADPLLVAGAWRLLALPFLLPLLPLALKGTPQPAFWPALVAGGALNVAAAILYMRALASADLSLGVPLLSFTPVLLLVTSPLMLGEVPAASGALGVVLIVAGSYLLGPTATGKGWLEPWRALWRQRGARMMLGVALLWSLSANIDKLGVQSSSPLLWVLAINAVIAMGLLPLLWLGRAQLRHQGRQLPWTWLLAVGLCGGLTTVLQMSAISLAQVPYVIAVKRLSILLAVFAGHFLLGEAGLRQRLRGTLVMLMGIVILALG